MKKYMRILTFGLLVSVVASATNYDHCNSLLQHGIKDITKYKSNKHAIAYKWHSYCGQDISQATDSFATQASASIFGLASGDGATSGVHIRNRVKSWCDNNKDFAQSRSDLYEEAKTISVPALEAWNQCQETAQRGIEIKVSIQNEYSRNVTFSIDSTANMDHFLLGVQTEGYKCSIFSKNGTEIDTQKIQSNINSTLEMLPESIVIDNKNIHISCTRNAPDIQEINGTGTITYNTGHITIMTTGPALPIGFSKVVEEYTVTPPNSVVAFAQDECPQGWEPYEEAYGRFVRGVDLTGSREIDPDGKREIGNIQEDMFKSHSHTHRSPRHYNSGAGGHARAKPDGRGTTGNTGGDETRPKNVALLYCVKQ